MSRWGARTIPEVGAAVDPLMVETDEAAIKVENEFVEPGAANARCFGRLCA